MVDFSIPDSTCVGAPIAITNLTNGGTTCYWNFCSGNANNDPSGVNIGNPFFMLDVPTYMTLVRQDNTCYSFVSNQESGVIRYNHGNTFNNYPISGTILGKFGILGENTEGIQVKYDDGNWYGFVCNDNTLVRLDFGNSLSNTPSAMDIGPFTMLNMAHGLGIIKEGTTWLGFVTCTFGGNMVRFNFGNSLANIPTAQDLGNIAGWSQPGPLCIVNENSKWWILTTSGIDNSLCRVDFGNSLLNAPTGKNLGNPGGFSTVGGLSIMRDCDMTSGYYVNYVEDGQLGKIDFTKGIDGPVTGHLLGNIGQLNKPHCFSEIFRQNDTLFTYITNRGDASLTRLTFPPCNNSSILSSSLYTPPLFFYDKPGAYNIRLLVNENMPDQVSLCKTIIVGPKPHVDLGPDEIICSQSAVLDAGPGFSSYLWSTGDTLRTVSISDSGNYWVRVSHYHCEDSDTIHVVFKGVNVNLGPDQSICKGDEIILHFSAPGTTYEWQDGSHDTLFNVDQPGTYWIHVKHDSCITGDTVIISECSSDLFFPDAFSPNNDNLNDIFRPRGLGIFEFHMEIYNRWGTLLFSTNDIDNGWEGTFGGKICPVGVYSYFATYKRKDQQDILKKRSGTFILVR